MNHDTYRDAFDLLCGEKIGSGYSRQVFECRILPDCVVKVEDGYGRYFANVFEQKFWDDNKEYKEISKWLAPCEFLSADGRLLIQKKCDPVRKSELPKKIPSFLTDLKIKNFGMYQGRLVCLDYAITIMHPSHKLVKADWW